MTAQTLYLAMVLAAFSTFVSVLAFVSLWSRFPRTSARPVRAPRAAAHAILATA